MIEGKKRKTKSEKESSRKSLHLKKMVV